MPGRRTNAQAGRGQARVWLDEIAPLTAETLIAAVENINHYQRPVNNAPANVRDPNRYRPEANVFGEAVGYAPNNLNYVDYAQTAYVPTEGVPMNQWTAVTYATDPGVNPTYYTLNTEVFAAAPLRITKDKQPTTPKGEYEMDAGD
jgi:hypothetical protein